LEITPNPTQDWLPRQTTEAFPWDTALVICCGTETNPRSGIPSSRSSDADAVRRYASPPRYAEDTASIDASLPKRVRNIGSVAHKTADLNDFTRLTGHRDGMARGQGGKPPP
jgi:hypothetical protein